MSSWPTAAANPSGDGSMCGREELVSEILSRSKNLLLGILSWQNSTIGSRPDALEISVCYKCLSFLPVVLDSFADSQWWLGGKLSRNVDVLLCWQADVTSIGHVPWAIKDYNVFIMQPALQFLKWEYASFCIHSIDSIIVTHCMLHKYKPFCWAGHLWQVYRSLAAE